MPSRPRRCHRRAARSRRLRYNNELPLTLFFLLPFLAQQHETVVVTGTYDPLSLEEIDRAIRVLPARQNNLVLNSLSDLIRLDPSLDLRERAPNGVQADLSIRGAGFGQTLVLLNGQRINDVQSGHHNMDIPVPLDSVARIEVMRGSGSTMYGSDAVGGVVNIVTEPPESTEFRLRTAVGNYGINQQRGSISGVFGRFSQQLTFARDFSTGFIPNRDYRNLQLSSSTAARTALGTSRLTLAYMDHPFGAEQFYGNFNSWENTKTWFAGGQQQLGERTTASFAYRRHSDLFVLYRDRPDVFANHHSDESYQGAVRRSESLSPTAHFYYGVETLHESVRSNNLGNHSRSRSAAYAALDLRALRRFSLSISAREEVFRRWSGAFTPTVSGGVWLSPKFKLRASASRAFRIPGYTDLYYQDPGNRGSPDLRPERAWTYEGGIDWSPASRVRGEITVFHRRERDGIDYYRTGPTDIWRALNIQNLNFTGVESSLRYRALDFRYTALRGAQNTIAAGFTKYTFNYPEHSAVAMWQGSLPGGLIGRTRLGVLVRRARDPYAVWDLYAARSRGRVHPFFQIANVTSTKYQEILGVAMPGRTILGGLEFVLRK
jgi:iron complex outermembrane recepter protein